MLHMVTMGVYVFAHCAWQVTSVIQRRCFSHLVHLVRFPYLFVLHFVFRVVLEDNGTGASYLTLASAVFRQDRNKYFPSEGLCATLCRLFFMTSIFPHI